MTIVVASCWKYRDAHMPFAKLLKKFWPSCKYPTVLLTDKSEDATMRAYTAIYLAEGSWCEMVADAATGIGGPILLMQEDFFLNGAVNELLVEQGLQQLDEREAAMVRLYPCPGGDIPYGDKWYAEIPKGAPYRVSCQATIWRPDVLHKIAFTCDTPADFEIRGSKVSNEFDEPFLAFRRDVQPWPISYLCSSISRGCWEPAAKELCDLHGIEVDWTMRPFRSIASS